MHINSILYMESGSLRRKEIVDWIKGNSSVGLAVNNKYQFNIQKDKDLQVLLKKGVLKQKRVHKYFNNPGRRSGCHQTYLVLA